MVNWEKLLKERSYTPIGTGAIIDYYDAEAIALIAYIEGMEMYNTIMKEWSTSKKLDPEVINKRVEDHIQELKKRFNITDDGREFPANSSM